MMILVTISDQNELTFLVDHLKCFYSNTLVCESSKDVCLNTLNCFYIFSQSKTIIMLLQHLVQMADIVLSRLKCI